MKGGGLERLEKDILAIELTHCVEQEWFSQPLQLQSSTKSLRSWMRGGPSGVNLAWLDTARAPIYSAGETRN